MATACPIETVLPETVTPVPATGRASVEIVILPETPSTFVIVISVPATKERVVAVPAPVRTTNPLVAKAAKADKSASYACTFVPITKPRVVLAAAASASSTKDLP